MTKDRKSLKIPRLRAFNSQDGCCYYCGQPMWTDDPKTLSDQYRISEGQAKQLFCTGEHLVAHSDGGTATQSNIVAACWYCNKHRHDKKKPPNPGEFRKLVRDRLREGRWHGLNLIS